jgi:hypothetical protein
MANTETVRVRQCTARALRKIAYKAPFECSSIAEFLRLVERGDLEAIGAWQKEARRQQGETD